MGYTCIPNEAIELGLERAKFTKLEAIVWLYKEGRRQEDGLRKVTHSLRFISKAWGWCVSSVRKLLDQLVAQGVAQKVHGKIFLLEDVKPNGQHTNGHRMGYRKEHKLKTFNNQQSGRPSKSLVYDAFDY